MKKVETLKTPKNRFLLTGDTLKFAADAGENAVFQNLKFDVGLNWIWKIIILASWKNVFYFLNKNKFIYFQKIFS